MHIINQTLNCNAHNYQLVKCYEMVLLTKSQLLIFTYTLLATLSLTTIITSFIIKNLSMNVKWHCFSTVPLLIWIYVHSHILFDDNNIWRVGHNNENNNCSIEILSLRDQIIMQIRRQIRLQIRLQMRLQIRLQMRLQIRLQIWLRIVKGL